MAHRDPSWGADASKLRTQYSDNFKQSLKDIAEGIARHEPSEKVLARHVHDAFSLLSLAGNRRLPWHRRHEAEVAIGGALIGVSASVPTWIETLYPQESPWRHAAIWSVTFVALASGVFLLIHGWLRVRRVVVWSGSRSSADQ